MDQEKEALFKQLEQRFRSHMERHPDIAWKDVLERLQSRSGKVRSLAEMDRTGGEPDVVGYDPASDCYIFVDCSAETPSGRRSLCYDHAALESRRSHPPKGNVCDLAEGMGIEILDEAQYRQLQDLGAFDLKTSSWIRTPRSIRELGGALFCDRRYDTVFTYHNGAESYYGSRGFRGLLRV